MQDSIPSGLEVTQPCHRKFMEHESNAALVRHCLCLELRHYVIIVLRNMQRIVLIRSVCYNAYKEDG
jgi:hypothetical protein